MNPPQPPGSAEFSDESLGPGGQKSEAAKDLFLTTRWTVVLQASQRDAPEAAQALEDLCKTYWYPLYAYVRRQNRSREEAEDLVQGFFESLLRRNYFQGLSSEKGKFRAFLLAALKHFLANEWDRAGRQKRGGHVMHLAMDWQKAETRYRVEPADPLTPDKLYDRTWALTVLERVLAQLSAEHVMPEKAQNFAVLKPFLMLGTEAIPYARAADALGMTEAAARVAVHRLRRRYRELLEAEIVQTLSDPAQLQEELRALQAAFFE